MELRADGLAFRIVFARPDVEGWITCHAVVNAPGFQGEVDFSMLRSDLDGFRVELAGSVNSANWPCEVHLASTEPGVNLRFCVQRSGRITGEYAFGGPIGDRPVLTGSFAMDQTYLGPLLAEVDRVLVDSG